MIHFDIDELSALEAEFDYLGHDMRRWGKQSISEGTADSRFRSWFGVSWTVAAKCWVLLCRDPEFDASTQSKKHFLWGLMLMMEYGTMKQMAANAGGVDEDTFAKHAWRFVDLISLLERDLVSK